MHLESREVRSEIAGQMLDAAHRMCFTEHALEHALPVTRVHTLNAEPI